MSPFGLVGPDSQLRFFTVRDKMIGKLSVGCRAITAFPLIHEVYPAAVKKFQHSSGLKRSQISPIALMR